MQIRIVTRKVGMNRAMETLIRKQLVDRLTAFARAIDRVQVELFDRNGRRGGGDKCCRIELVLAGGDTLRSDEMQANLRTAFRHAADRLESAVRRALRAAK
jgi:ribosome-associated translation inhibitor RaiA